MRSLLFLIIFFATFVGAQEISHAGKIYKSTKFGMFNEKISILEKFRIFKELGYDGIEIDTPCSEEKKQEFVAASKETGMPIHGSVNSQHWGVRMSDKDPEVRKKAVETMKKCIQDTFDVGGFSVLLVPGRVNDKADEGHDAVWSRSIECIRECIPLASKLGVQILIETVWNGFCTNPEDLKKYIDEINSPWVRVYFDIGNMQKFSPPAQWIRVLGDRTVKLDVKDWGVTAGFCKIGDGDVDWADVRKALSEIGFTGWSTAEVRGGDRQRIAEIAERMNKALGLK
jgi:L-ribulose-5-phosphate 3-epimerase